MQFLSITTLIVTAVLAIAAPTAEHASGEIVARGYTAPSGSQCTASGGSLTCCSSTQSSSDNPLDKTVATLLGIDISAILPNLGIDCGIIGAVAVGVNACGQSTVCCQNPTSNSQTGNLIALGNVNLLTCNAISL